MITDGDGILHDKVATFPGCWVGFKQCSLLDSSFYVTFGLEDAVSRGTLRRMRKLLRESPGKLVCQIDLQSPRATEEAKFAQFFGFRGRAVIGKRYLEMERN